MLCLRTWSICRWECDKHPSLSDVNVSLFLSLYLFPMVKLISFISFWWFDSSEIGVRRTLVVLFLFNFILKSRFIFQVHYFSPFILISYLVECIPVCPASVCQCISIILFYLLIFYHVKFCKSVVVCLLNLEVFSFLLFRRQSVSATTTTKKTVGAIALTISLQSSADSRW